MKHIKNDIVNIIRNQKKLTKYEKIISSNKLTAFSEKRDMTEFNKACELFRNTCEEIKTFLNLDKFTGGYDEILTVMSLDQFKSNEGIILTNKLNIANSLCNHEAKKIGLAAPEWFYKCWEK